ncbi:PREDICTED: clathrin interactor EPSIN 3-like isoform X1 [Lupinus angustifolius]|uniref:clathrin interactor EPSIN 3-like isoform X1 n=1 Tax=Lupinus angustifolius TaxID=3871 RepID=UPI00092F54DD|nr:PREDICTED: clathrin interactor EPSIN 3-like isoform X1 [Lupinus angustifolius]XP_019428521.1 PREDICTED: clathrin interactor EPSIN 3-like isoform X1 [Lupinus angustifolius]XP_019428522.1 PREDICTED: clathrin interactor EPSIN 3-like isoform X1 [Lupinus angustifolius]XP_019428523.1 PREDICTED: clathrin interactor EPSIN 3-like isoform X1 [Lupinus angustifolius]XP_019428524.1 PREDICTED: clathrin interactor EPSIN 3-like isoform X1 [Lupinus angustifolius]
MKKAIGQTVRDLKRGVNKKVLKVPGIEQKVLDATSNEAWGPHGSLLADIAQASRNYHEYQMIMAVIWKRINDTGKNWRHVYKALTVLEYLVGHGSERVIEEIKEHAYQISTLSNFQYLDSSGRDQGNNVRKKSESLVILVNDKERIIEVRQKAAANRDKFHNNSAGGMPRPGSYSSSGAYGDRYNNDSYGSREEDRSGSGYGREREWGSRDGDRYSRDGDRYSRDGDRYGRDYEKHSSKDGYRNDEYSGRNQSFEDYQYGSRSRSSDRDHDRGYDDDGQRSSRGSSAKAEDRSLEGRLERKLSEQITCTPPSYEEVVGESRSPPTHNGRDGETSAASAPKGSFPVSDNPQQPSAPPGSSLMKDSPTKATAAATTSAPGNKEVEGFDEFDPRGPASAAPATANNAEVDLFGSLSESLPPVPSSATTTLEGNIDLDSTASFAAAPSTSNNFNQSFEDPFGDTPFKAIPSTETAPSQPQTHHSLEPSQSSGPNVEAISNFGFGDSFSVVPFSTSGASDTQSFSTNTQFVSQDFSTPPQETDILADILPPAPLPGMTSQQNSAPPDSQSSLSFSAPFGQIASQTSFVQSGQLTQQGFSAPTSQPALQAFSFSAPSGQPIQPPFSSPTSHVQQPFSAHASQSGHQAFTSPSGQPLQPPFSSPSSQHAQQPFSVHGGQPGQQPFSAHAGQPGQQPFSAHAGQPTQPSGHMYGGFQSQAGSLTPGASDMFLPQGSTAPIPSHMAPQAPTGQSSQSANYFPQQGGFTAHGTSHLDSQFSTGQASKFNSGNFITQGNAAPSTHQPSPFGGSNSIVSQPSKDKFETKSTVWNDTLSRGLVNLNISGAKINPLSDIGIDFDAINRKEKRMEKPTTTAVTSTITMGKAMGSSSGIGRTGAGALRPSPNPLMGMSMGSGPGVGIGMGMGSYGGINAPMGMGMGQGVQMQPPPGSDINLTGNYNNPMMGTGSAGYPQHQQPYGGGGYR